MERVEPAKEQDEFRLDCITGNAERIMRVKCPLIENMPLVVRVLNCGNPSVNGVYKRYDSNGWAPKDIYYANDNGIFLTQRHIAEKNLLGGRMRIAEREWVLGNKSKGLDYYVSSILDEGEEDEEQLIFEPPSDGWRPVKGVGALPCPTVVVNSRGYAAVDLDKKNEIVVVGKSNTNSKAKETSHRQSADGEDILTGDIFQQVAQNKKASIASSATCSSPGVDLVLASEQDEIVLGGICEVEDKLRSSIMNGFSPSQERTRVHLHKNVSRHRSLSAVARAAAASHLRLRRAVS